MAHIEFGATERALLLALMALGGSASNPELKERVGKALDGAARKKMNDLKLITSERDGRAPFRHTLEDAGWAWCVEELTAEPPARPGILLGRALYIVLPLLGSYLAQADLSLAEFVVRSKATAAPVVDDEAPAPPPPTGPSEENLEERVREAYWSLAEKPRDWVLITRLRPLLGDASRADVDAALRRMERLPDVSIAPEADQKTLTEQDWEAAVRIGGKSKHLLSIEAR